MIFKIPTIKCHTRDFDMYYSSTLLLDSNDNLYIYRGDWDSHVELDEHDEDGYVEYGDYDIIVEPVYWEGGTMHYGDNTLINPSRMYSFFMPPFYDRGGRYLGIETGRNYKRSCPASLLDCSADLQEVLLHGTVDGRRADTYVGKSRSSHFSDADAVILHRGDVHGFIVGNFCKMYSPLVKERIESMLGGYDVTL